jgi:transcriptional regulator with XRE-family HTH domain
MTAGQLIREARVGAGLSQAQLGRRLGVSQPAVARLEKAGDGIAVDTLRRTLGALGRDLELAAPARSSVDESLLREQLRLTPSERLEQYDGVYAGLREFALAVRR